MVNSKPLAPQTHLASQQAANECTHNAVSHSQRQKVYQLLGALTLDRISDIKAPNTDTKLYESIKLKRFWSSLQIIFADATNQQPINNDSLLSQRMYYSLGSLHKP